MFPKVVLRFSMSLFFFYSLAGFLYASCTPSGTGGDDTVICTGTTNGYQEFYGGSDHVTLSSGTTGSGIFWLDTRNGGDSATDGNDTFIANGSLFSWVFGFNGDDYFDVNRSKFRNLYADTNPNWVEQRGNDTIIIENSVSNGWILGGNDNDTLMIKDSNVSFVASGYSDIYSDLPGYIDYTPYDGDDNITLDNVDFNVTNYAYPNRAGAVEGGKANDTIRFINGGNAYSVTGGHGDDTIIVEDDTQFNKCIFVNDRNKSVACGIYGDEPYASEPGGRPVAAHGDDNITLKNGHLLDIVVNGGDGSDSVSIFSPVRLFKSVLDGGDDREIADGFVDTLTFDGWSGDLNGSLLVNWEQIVFQNGARISFDTGMVSTGHEPGTAPQTNLPYGLNIVNGASLVLSHDLTVEGNVHNEGTIDLLQDGNVTTRLIVENDYSGDAGTVALDVVLNDASLILSDRLIINGASSGTTWLQLHNLNGMGGQTPTGDNEGILLVEVHGSANGTFALRGGSVIVNGYEYKLVQGSSGNWYLQSDKIEKKLPEPTPTPPCPNPCPAPCPLPPDPHTIIVSDAILNVIENTSVTQSFPVPTISASCTGALTFSVVTEPLHGDVVISEGEGGYTYVPETDYIGRDYFSYRAETRKCISNIATVSVIVNDDTNRTGTIKKTPAYSGWSLLLIVLGTVLLAYRNRQHV
jgi:hypothetical protein